MERTEGANNAFNCSLKVKLDRLILQMNDIELEQFCRQWVERKATGYFEVKRFGGAGDKGRDVVGFCSEQRHDGDWDNYQCKQYRTKLGKADGILAVAKILYWASQKQFTSPRQFIFVAPKGLNSTLLSLVNQPASFKAEMIAKWNDYCATKIISNVAIELDGDVLAAVNAFDFSTVSYVDVDEIIENPASKPLLFELFGTDPGAYPKGTVPSDVQDHEMVYMDALLGAYNEREKGGFSCHGDVLSNAKHGDDLRMHRSRYYEADGFQKFYRDNTTPETIAEFRRNIRYGIHDTLNAQATDELARVHATMTQAANLQPGGPLHPHAHIPVKQGICHHLVNDEEISWKAPK